jgi:DNA-binding PadR family transcriptional regulator
VNKPSAADNAGSETNHVPAGTMPTTAYLVLGILISQDEELSVGEIKTRADLTVGQFYWSPVVSHIRRELRRLIDQKLVAERTVTTGRRTAILYRTTDLGAKALREWIEHLSADEPVVLKHPVMLKLWMARDADPDVLIGSLDRHIGAVQARIDDLQWAARRSEEVGTSDDPQLQYPAAVMRYTLRYLYSEQANVRQLRDEISRSTDEDPIRRVKRVKGTLRKRHVD